MESKPESLLTAIESNNQDLIDLETLIEERGKQVASLQFILANEVGLVDKVIRTKGRLGEFESSMRAMAGELNDLKVYVR